VGTDTAWRNEYQELDQAELFRAVTKWNHVVPDAGRAAELTRAAILAATRGCPGPAHLDIPRDFFEQPCSEAEEVDLSVGQISGAAADPAALERIVAEVRSAERPLILAGSGLLIAGAELELERLAEEGELPVATTAGGKGSFNENHPLAVGVVGRYSRKVANDLAARADLVLAVGTRLGALATDGYRLPRREARVIQVDADPQVLGSSRPAHVAVQADLKLALAQLVGRLAGSANDHRSEWLEEVRSSVAGWRAALSKLVQQPDDGDGLRGEQVMAALRRHASDEDTLVSDTGYMAAWTAVLYPITKPGRRYLRCAGSLGWAFPAAIGVQMARPRSRALCVIGDGGLGYHIGDLETAVRTEMPTITLVLNNRSLAYEYQIQKHLYDNTIIPEANDFADVDYGAVARAFGAFGTRVWSTEELDTALAEATAERRPALIDVIISKEQPAPVTSYESVLERDI
jgi:acetolactate synthase-1/2/3 large subunit